MRASAHPLAFGSTKPAFVPSRPVGLSPCPARHVLQHPSSQSHSAKLVPGSRRADVDINSVRAVAARAVETLVESNHASSSSGLAVDETFTLPKGNATVQVTVQLHDEGAQTIRVSTALQAGRLLLHWGVEGGNDYKGGWRLPGPAFRPQGTTQYKDRALQSPFNSAGERSEVVIELPPNEASNVLNFVLKDDATNTWYDNNNSNFSVSLRAEEGGSSSHVEVLPKQLCDKWAWVRWDFQGRATRSEQQANTDYDLGVEEMTALLAKGRALDELWRVAESKWKYSDYREKVISSTLGEEWLTKGAANKDAAPAPSFNVGPVPDDLIAVQAYVLWEKAGKPEGADFSHDARKLLEDRAKAGTTYFQLAAELDYTPKWTSSNLNGGEAPKAKSNSNNGAPALPPKKEVKKEQNVEQKAEHNPKQKTEAKKEPEQKTEAKNKDKESVHIGDSTNPPMRNPLDMIKPQSSAPILSDKKAPRQAKPLDFLVEHFALKPETKWRRVYSLGNKSEMLAVVRQGELGAAVKVDFFSDLASPLVLHWGVTAPGSKEWVLPPQDTWPASSAVAASGIACDTPFLDCDDDECDVSLAGSKVPIQRLTVTIQPGKVVGGLILVMHSSDSTMWYKDAGGNFLIPIPGAAGSEASDGKASSEDPHSRLDDLGKVIADSESTGAWTLMHRFNKAADLIKQVQEGYFESDVADAMSKIFVWLRYSSTRKLTWQRNYNTQPRILSDSQERLTKEIAAAHGRTKGEVQEYVRMMLTCVGRGGDGQKIRDEILNIMHRNHISEVKGTWMEEWHQKLHNNTTPDDVPICEAFIAFLSSGGNASAYWRVLSDAGITRERLAGYDRPIVQEPQMFHDKKDALINDFNNYLGVLKAVHSGADMQASAAAAGNKIPGEARGYLGYVLSHMKDSQTLPLMEAAVEARTELAPHVSGNKELLYLDLALEEQVRSAAERGVGSAGMGAAAFMKPLLQNLCLSLGDNEELCYCLKTWQELPVSVRTGGRVSKEEALQAVAVINRIRRAITTVSDSIVNRIGEPSRLLGECFGVEAWARDLFAEEVVRGGPAFAVSLVVTSVEASLRSAAELGAWQVISPHQVTGIVEVVEALHAVQEKTYKQPTVLLVSQVTGEEEIPEGVVAVITPDAPDVLSHVSVRARNMRVLFATCHDPEPLAKIKAAVGKTLSFSTTASGSVSWTEVDALVASAGSDSDTDSKPTKGLKIEVPTWSGKWVVGMDEYKKGVVGAKSNNLALLRGKLPEQIKLPASVTLPFGCFEQALELPENKEIKQQLATLVKQVLSPEASKPAAAAPALPVKAPTPAAAKAPAADARAAPADPKAAKAAVAAKAAPAAVSAEHSVSSLLAECRKVAMQVVVPPSVRQDLAVAMEGAGIPVPEDEKRWSAALEALKGVWASKYNDRAYYSMRKVGLNFDDVRMAVLVQRVVPAQYAFVIHTRNPSNNDEQEVFCEMVRGLGESLVSGMIAGSAVAFKANKADLDNPEVLCYASKSEGMFVPESLIFRSDSNGEDLEGYAGAGLYESITMDTTETKKVDYMDDKLVKDPAYRKELLSSVCKVGMSIETALGSAQDVEGVVDTDGVITIVQTRPQV